MSTSRRSTSCRQLNHQVYERVPGVMMIAEESTAFHGVTRPLSEGGLGFGFKWNMGWMNDTLRYLALDPIHRQYDHHDMTFAMLYQYTEHYILPISHDEVVHGKGSMPNKIPQDPWRQFATLRAYYSFMWAFPGKKILFMGCDFGQRSEWNEEASLEWWVTDLWGHRGLQRHGPRPQRAVPGASGPVEARQRPGRASSGSTTTTPGPTRSPGCVPTVRVSRSPASSTSHHSPGPATGSGCPRPGRGWRSSTPTARCTTGPAAFTNPGPITATADPHDGFAGQRHDRRPSDGSGLLRV